jgi:hypothetical protein
MRLARSFWPDQHDGISRPLGPAIDQRQRIGVGRSGEKILAGQTFGMGQRERKLPRRRYDVRCHDA